MGYCMNGITSLPHLYDTHRSFKSINIWMISLDCLYVQPSHDFWFNILLWMASCLLHPLRHINLANSLDLLLKKYTSDTIDYLIKHTCTRFQTGVIGLRTTCLKYIIFFILTKASPDFISPAATKCYVCLHTYAAS